MAAPHANCFLPATERAPRGATCQKFTASGLPGCRHPAARRPDNVMRRTRSYAGGRRNPSIPPERFRCATIVLANLGRATGRFVRSPTAPRPLVFLLGSVLKAGLCRTGLDRAATCPHSLQGPPKKGLAIGRNSSGTAVNPGRPERSEILPRRLHRRDGASVVRRQSRSLPNGGSQC
jgi:hypothetical protein